MELSGPPNYLTSRYGEELHDLITEVKDWQISHGSLVKAVGHEERHTVPAIPIGATICPTPFPRRCFEQACGLQTSFNRLYAAIAEDDVWLESVLRDLIQGDEFVRTLWSLHCEAKKVTTRQDLNLGIFRSDYMLHTQTDSVRTSEIKQVELNTYSCAGGTHGNIISDMHRHLQQKGMYYGFGKSQLPTNATIQGIISGLEQGHKAYGETMHDRTQRTCVLMVVQPLNVNICDERPIEYGLWSRNVPIFRVNWDELDEWLHPGNRDTLHYYRKPGYLDDQESWEVSVVYWRAGYDPGEYHMYGIEARKLVESSRAIKCPSISCHLATLKKVQQALAAPGVLERFLTPPEVHNVAKVFMNMFPLDTTPEGECGRALASEVDTARNYVLKPSLEGGGHNVYRAEIANYLSQTPEDQWNQYVLMELITPPAINNILISPTGYYEGPVVSELGIFGSCLWRSPKDGRTIEMIENDQFGWSFKTKSTEIDEMSVVKGYGCFDSPLLLDDDSSVYVQSSGKG